MHVPPPPQFYVNLIIIYNLHVSLPAQEQGLLLITSLNDDDDKIACSVVLPRNFRDRCPANSLEVL